MLTVEADLVRGLVTLPAAPLDLLDGEEIKAEQIIFCAAPN